MDERPFLNKRSRREQSAFPNSRRAELTACDRKPGVGDFACQCLGFGPLTSGLARAMVMGQVLRRFLFGIRPNDPLAFAAVCLILTAVGAAACFVPALRATRVSPLVRTAWSSSTSLGDAA